MLRNNTASRIVALHLLAVFFVMLNISSIAIIGLPKALPLFDVMIIFYFAIFRRMYSVWFLFLLGLWADALNGDPLGLTALCYIVLVKFFAAINQRFMIRENFHQVLQQFVAFCFLLLLIKWSVLSIFSHSFYTIITPLLQIILSSLFYVLIHRLLNHLSGRIFESE
jgi:rod shape-determining protein MreD